MPESHNGSALEWKHGESRKRVPFGACRFESCLRRSKQKPYKCCLLFLSSGAMVTQRPEIYLFGGKGPATYVGVEMPTGTRTQWDKYFESDKNTPILRLRFNDFVTDMFPAKPRLRSRLSPKRVLFVIDEEYRDLLGRELLEWCEPDARICCSNDEAVSTYKQMRTSGCVPVVVFRPTPPYLKNLELVNMLNEQEGFDGIAEDVLSVFSASDLMSKN